MTIEWKISLGGVTITQSVEVNESQTAVQVGSSFEGDKLSASFPAGNSGKAGRTPPGTVGGPSDNVVVGKQGA